MEAEAVAKPINERLERHKAPERRLWQIEKESDRVLELPQVTVGMADNAVAKVYESSILVGGIVLDFYQQLWYISQLSGYSWL